MLNKMPDEPAKKTASAPKARLPQKRTLWVLLVFLMVAIFAILGMTIYSRGGPGCIQIADSKECLGLERVSLEQDLEKGLSGRESMPENQGMLFTFESSGKHCFWMKDMKFPLDMIWINADKKVVYVKKNVQPSTYPNTFCPDQPALYVIEVNAGVADKAYLSPGSQLQF